MAQERYGFFNSTAEDERSYDSADMAAAFHALASDGVSDMGTCLQVTAEGSTMRTLVGYGTALIRGYYYQLKDDGGGVRAFAHTVETELARIDRIVLRLDLTARTIALAMRIGTAASTPAAPELTRDDETYEISLAQVLIRAGAAEILATDVTDEREDDAVCGLIAPESLRRADILQFISENTADAVRFSAQSLSEAAQAQARENIDAAKGTDIKFAIFNGLEDIGVPVSETVTLQDVVTALPNNSIFIMASSPYFTGNLVPQENANGTLFIFRTWSISGTAIYFRGLVDNRLWVNYAVSISGNWYIGAWQAISPVIEVSATLSTAWTGSAAPYTQSVSVLGMTAAKKALVGLPATATQAEYKAAAKAKLRVSSQGTDTVTVTAEGTKPAISIPILVTMVG